MPIFKTGDRVRVSVETEEERKLWAQGSLEAFEGKFGTITEVGEYPFDRTQSQYYVKFDEPAEKWALRSEDPEMNKIHGWHFQEEVLVPLFDQVRTF
jgi:hypothetical protein